MCLYGSDFAQFGPREVENESGPMTLFWYHGYGQEPKFWEVLDHS